MVAIRTASLRRAGFSRQKSEAILSITRVAATGRLDSEHFSNLDDAAAADRLLALPGIGRWSAEYVLLRGLGRWHVFPGDDVGARNHLQRWLGLRRSLDDESVCAGSSDAGIEWRCPLEPRHDFEAQNRRSPPLVESLSLPGTVCPPGRSYPGDENYDVEEPS